MAFSECLNFTSIDYFGAVEASEVVEAAEVNDAEVVSKACKITTVDFRVFQVIEFDNFRTNITLF